MLGRQGACLLCVMAAHKAVSEGGWSVAAKVGMHQLQAPASGAVLCCCDHMPLLLCACLGCLTWYWLLTPAAVVLLCVCPPAAGYGVQALSTGEGALGSLAKFGESF